MTITPITPTLRPRVVTRKPRELTEAEHINEVRRIIGIGTIEQQLQRRNERIEARKQ